MITESVAKPFPTIQRTTRGTIVKLIVGTKIREDKKIRVLYFQVFYKLCELKSELCEVFFRMNGKIRYLLKTDTNQSAIAPIEAPTGEETMFAMYV